MPARQWKAPVNGVVVCDVVGVVDVVALLVGEVDVFGEVLAVVVGVDVVAG